MMTGINVWTQVDQISSDVRQELILVSDIFGRSLFVDRIDHPKPAQASDSPVLGLGLLRVRVNIKSSSKKDYTDEIQLYGSPLVC